MHCLYKIEDCDIVKEAEGLIKKMLPNGRANEIETDSVGSIIFHIYSSKPMDFTEKINKLSNPIRDGIKTEVSIDFKNKRVKIQYFNAINNRSIVLNISHSEDYINFFL